MEVEETGKEEAKESRGEEIGQGGEQRREPKA